MKLVTKPIVNWLERWYDLEEDDTLVCDMEKVCRQHYFHPFTKGRSSIKPTLPAVLNENKNEAIINWLRSFTNDHDLYKLVNARVEDPYNCLPKIEFENLGMQYHENGKEPETFSSNPDDYIISNGGAAMRAYQDMMYGFAKNDPSKKEKIRNCLLLYCKLDTLAMVIIWRYWVDRCKKELKAV